MPGYSFQPQFVDPIRAGTKGGTIRTARRIPARWSDYRRTWAEACGNHAKQGDTLHLWCKLRTPGAFKIGERHCLCGEPITLRLDARLGGVIMHTSHLVLTTPSMLDAFAVFDGFENWQCLVDFWQSTHGDVSIFNGWHIRWLILPDRIDPSGGIIARRIADEELREADFQAGRI